MVELRHTFVALWVAAGPNPKEVSIRAGHSSVAFTLDRYGHLYEDAETRSRTVWMPFFPPAARPKRSPNPPRRVIGGTKMPSDLTFTGGPKRMLFKPPPGLRILADVL
jgi:hypothetical protein